MNNDIVLTVILYAGLAVLIVARQLSTRRIDPRRVLIAPSILLIIGLKQMVDFLGQHAVSDVDLASFVLSIAISIGLAFPRARSMRIWYADGSWWSRGTGLTLLLWVITLLVRSGVGALVGAVTSHGVDRDFEISTLLITAAASLGAQALIRVRRARPRDAEAA